jgi:REP element-mobilizing transposase RayT
MNEKQKYNPKIHHRKSIRLKGYDYSQAGLYFITICVQGRACLFGEIENGKMKLNDAGNIARNCWLEIPNHFPNAILHEHIIMPNHIHGIIELKTYTVGAENFPPNIANAPNIANGANITNAPNIANGANITNAVNNTNRANVDSPLRSPSKNIGSIVRGYKIGVTKWMRQNTDVYDVWQRNYYEHIIRDEQSYQRISDYIINNPEKWADDKFYNE